MTDRERRVSPANGRRYCVLTYGCQMNEHDSEVMAGLLESNGYTPAAGPEDADVLLVNTCAIRESAEEKVLGRLGEFRRLKARRPGLILGVAGCMTQQSHIAERIRTRAPWVDVVFGTHNLHRLPQLIERAKDAPDPVVEIWDKEGEVIEGLPAAREDAFRAWVTIMYGCDMRCAYCIVPAVRGRQRSRCPEDIVAEVGRLAAEGVKEVTLLGQIVNTYGRDLGGGLGFAALLEAVDRVPGIERIRYASPHPLFFSLETLDVIARSRHVCEHFHLPVQAGSDRILRLMKRGYTAAGYLRLLEEIRRRIPHATITTDLIVGFPGETEEDFAATLELVRRAEFDNAFTFLFSPRVGTAAAEMAEQVAAAVKAERLQRLTDLQYGIGRRKNDAYLGRRVEVLVEGRSDKDPRRLSGRTRGNKVVLFPGGEELAGRLVDVEIREARTFTLYGECAG